MQNLQEFEPWLEELNLTLKDGGIFLLSSATDNWRIKLEYKTLEYQKNKKKEKSVGHTIICQTAQQM